MGRQAQTIMLAAFLSEPGEIELREIKTPEPGPGEILVKVKAALTCGTDLKAFIRGHSLIPMPGPFGHEFSGTVAMSRAKGFKEGDDLMAVHSAPCLKCRYCKKGLYNLCESIMSSKILGAFSEHMLLPSHIVRQNVFRKPKGLSFEEAALLEPLSCVMRSVKISGANAGSKTFQNILIIGAGPIGLLHLLLLKNKKLKAAVVDINEKRLRAARRLGADLAFKPDAMQEAIDKLSGGIGFDAVFECTGRPEVWESSVYTIRRGGTAILFGGCPSGTKVTYDAHRLHYDEINLRGVFHFTPEDVRDAHGLLSGGGIPFKKLITAKIPLKDIKKAFDKLSKGDGIKYAIIP